MKSVIDTTEKFKISAIAFIVGALLFASFAYANAQTIPVEKIDGRDVYTSSSQLPTKSVIVPYGAPETGFGGSTQLERMNSNTALPLLALVFLLLVGSGLFYAAQDLRERK